MTGPTAASPEPGDGHGDPGLYQASPRATACPLEDGLAIFDLGSNSYFSLNRSAALLWAQAGEPVSLAGLTAAMARAYAKPEADVAGDVARVVTALVEARLLLLVPAGVPPV